MKKFILILFCIITYSANAQDDPWNPITEGENIANDKSDLHINLVDNQNKPLAFIGYWLVEKETQQKLPLVSDSKGRTTVPVIRGYNYSLNFTNHENFMQIAIPLKGMGLVVKTVRCDFPEVRRLTAIPDTLHQTVDPTELSRTETVVAVELINGQKKPVEGVEVRLFNHNLFKVFVAQTNENGKAYFRVPRKMKYNISINNLNDCSEISIAENQTTVGKLIKYELPIAVNERISNDTIYQQIDDALHATSSQVYVKIQVTDFESQALSGEPIWINVMESNTVYSQTTGDDGKAQFLLPVGKKYVLHFKYDRNIDMFDYTNVPRFALYSTDIKYRYRGSQAIETFFKEAKRDKNGFLTEFNTSEITPIEKPEKFIEKTKYGYNLVVPNEKEMTTPSITNNNLIFSGGFYSPELYCADQMTGTFKWGVRLAESGISSSVINNGIALVNTESCTLYAIDINSGKLLWSKWLSTYLFTSPSVSNDKVYVVYGNNTMLADSVKADKKFVLACLKLQTGEIVWQNWIDGEGIACPVVANDNVYLTTAPGSLYQFDAQKGTQKSKVEINATSAPTVVGDKVYISCRNANDEIVTVLKSANLEKLTIFDNLKSQFIKLTTGNLYPCIAMNYTGSRTVNFRGMNYNVLYNRLVCSSPDNGSIVWSLDLSNEQTDFAQPVAQTPAIAGGKLILTTQSGKLMIINPANGTVQREFFFEEGLGKQVVCSNGRIFTGSQKGKMVCVDTKDKTLTGWNLWSFDAAHNMVIK